MVMTGQRSPLVHDDGVEAMEGVGAAGRFKMTAHIEVTRGRSLRSAGVLYDVTVDGEAVGRLKRGQTISHEVEPGTHDVKVLFAETGWQVPNPKTSPTMTYTVGDSETLVPWSTSIHPDQAALLDYPRWGLSSLGCVTGVSPVAGLAT